MYLNITKQILVTRATRFTRTLNIVIVAVSKIVLTFTEDELFDTYLWYMREMIPNMQFEYIITNYYFLLLLHNFFAARFATMCFWMNLFPKQT